jgi:undecaprenyl-diphosphatase
MIAFLEHIDREVLFAINGAHNAFFDAFFFFISNKYFWIPLYMLFAYCLIKKRTKTAHWYFIAIIVLISLSDLSSVHLFKNVFERYRPSHNHDIQHLLHYVNDYRGGLYGFISSHAANTMALAVFMLFSLEIKKKGIVFLFLFWSVLVSYSRVYLGVHYPSDVIVGMLWGALLAIALWFLLKAALKKWNKI